MQNDQFELQKIFAPDLKSMQQIKNPTAIRQNTIAEIQNNAQNMLKNNSKNSDILKISKTVNSSSAQPQVQNSQISYLKQPLPVTFNELGGLDYLLQKIEQYVVNSLIHPDAFRKFGAEPLCGVLLTGPTGVGKTTIASAIFNMCIQKLELQKQYTSVFTQNSRKQQSINFLSVNAPELISSKTGETEQFITNLFNEAINNQPAMIFIDQLDILAVKQESTQREFEKRVASALANALDSLSGQSVVVLAATSKPTSLEPSLRRPGRFDVELEILIPSREQRFQIIQKFIKLPSDDIRQIAALTPGYVPADLHQLLREAAIDAYQKSQQSLNLNNFKVAVKHVQPTAKREGFANIPTFSLDKIGGLQKVKEQLVNFVLKPIQKPEIYKRLGLPTTSGVVLYGAPGNGKSLLCRAIAAHAEANFISVKGPELLNQYVGESERAVRVLFERARAARPVVVFLDECECICRLRGGDSNGVTDRVVNQFLTELDGVESSREGVFIIATTNRLDLLDRAILRPGRLEHAIYVPLPQELERADILLKQSMECAKDDDVNLELFTAISKYLEGYSGADLQAIVKIAGQKCIERNGDRISRQDFVGAAQEVRRSVTDQDLQYYRSIEELNK